MVLVLFDGHTDVEGRKQRKYVGLNCSHQNLYQIDENHEHRGYSTDPVFVKNKPERKQTQNDYVPGRYRRK